MGVPRRDEFGRWVPGETGNPSGRPVVLGPVRDLARQYTVEAVRALVDVAVDVDAPPAARVAAAREILDRGHGRPRPTPEVRDDAPLEHLTDDELDALIDADEAAGGRVVGVRRLA